MIRKRADNFRSPVDCFEFDATKLEVLPMSRLASSTTAGASNGKAITSFVIEPNSDKARKVEAEIKLHPNALFFRAKAIEANVPNTNGDYFSEEELQKGCNTFVGVPFFTNHDNQNVENARGKIIHAEWNQSDKSIYTIAFIDRDAYPHLCRSIEERYASGVSMGAINAGSMVLMSDMTEKPIEEVKPGEMVVSHKGNVQRVASVHSAFLGSDMYEFGLQTYHKSPLFTYDHPILTIDKDVINTCKRQSICLAKKNHTARQNDSSIGFVGQDSWRKENYAANFKDASQIQVGDYFMVPSRFFLVDGTSEKSDFYYIVGAYLGDGYLQKNKKGEYCAVEFCFGLDEIELTGHITKLLKKYSDANVNVEVIKARNGIYISIFDKDLVEWLATNVGSGSKTKRIKFDIKCVEDARQLLCGYLDTDGCIVDKTAQVVRGNKFGGFQISSANHSLLEDVQQILIGLGYVSRISSSNRTPGKNSVVNVNTIENTLSTGSNSASVFSDAIKYKQSEFSKSQIKAGKTFVTKIEGMNYMACPVKCVKVHSAFNEPVYDLTVENDESYVADGLAVHNCTVEYSVCNICGNRAEKTEDYCFVTGTTITMSDLSVKNIESIQVGDMVLDAFGSATKVVGTSSHDVDEIVQKITSKAINGELVCTSNHPFLVERRGEYRFVPSEFLLEKETLFTPIAKIDVDNSLFNVLQKYSIEDSDVNRLKLSKLIGYFIAEGYMIKTEKRGDIGINISLHSDEIDYLNEIVSICESVFNKTPEIVDRTIYNHKCKELRIYHPFVVDLMNLSCLGKANKKVLSKQIISLDKKYLQEIIAGYIDGDGYCDAYGRIIITTASRDLAHQVMYLLNMMGVPPSIYSYMQDGGPNHRDKKTEIFRVSIAKLQTLPLNNSSIKSQKSISISKTNVNVSRLKNAFSNDGFVKHSAYSIEEVPYCGPVYNFETETHSYVANNTSVHNCTHIKNKKGRKFTGTAKNVVTGALKQFRNEPVFEFNYGIKFIELSAVVDPACPTCHIQDIICNDDYLKKVANLQNNLFMIRTAAIDKHAGKEELDQIDGVLKTLEDIAINLIKQRKQVEPEFAGDLVQIITDLQEWFDELTAAGYGNFNGQVPGVDDGQGAAPSGGQPPAQAPGGAPGLPPPLEVPGLPPASNPMDASASMPSSVGQVAGSPGKPMTSAPNLPISAPIRPKANVAAVMKKVAGFAEKFLKTGDDDMTKRRTLAAKMEDKERAKELLSKSWKEKQEFFEYIKSVPSIQDNECRLSIKKKDDTFVIVAESKEAPVASMVWTYENLTQQQKDVIRQNPRGAAEKLLKAFANSIKHKKEGETKMTEFNKAAGANSVNRDPEVVTEKQLADETNLYHARTGEEAEVVTEKQLDSKRKNDEPEVLTEKQLEAKRTGEEAEVVTEKQLYTNKGAMNRTETEAEVITEKQLEGNRVNNEPDVITEKQLSKVDAPWARAARRDSAKFISAGAHMDKVLNVIADTVMASGCTPDEACAVASNMVGSTKARYELASSILETPSKETVDYAKRLAFWSNKNMRISTVTQSTISELIVNGLRKSASEQTVNPEVLISAVDVIGEGERAIPAIVKKVEEKMALAAVDSKKSSVRDELRSALGGDVQEVSKRNKERNNVLASITDKMTRAASTPVASTPVASTPAVKQPDTKIVTTFDEMGLPNDTPRNDEFKKNVVAFCRGACAHNQQKLASITNVTISGDTISIAVQTDDGSQSVEIPIGQSSGPGAEEVMPETDMSGEGLENTMGAGQGAGTAAATTQQPVRASNAKTVKTAQTPAGAAMPGAAAGAEAQLPGGAPTADPVQSLMQGAPGAADENTPAGDAPQDAGEVPSTSERQMPWSICPECGSNDVDITQQDDGGVKGICKNPECGAEYEALMKKNVEFTLLKPTKSVGTKGTPPVEQPEVPEVPALPVAAQTSLDRGAIVRIAKNQKSKGHVCPACGTCQCKPTKASNGHTEYTCPKCATATVKDVLLSTSNPAQSALRVAWMVYPDVDSCKSCKEKAVKLASDVRVRKMLKTAAKDASDFPMANCIERVARQYGGDTVASFGPCKGKPVSDCICKELQRLGMRTVRHMERMATVAMEKDPMEKCLEEQKKKGLETKQAKSICDCVKNKVLAEVGEKDVLAAKAFDNPYLAAFLDDIRNGREKMVTASDLVALKSILDEQNMVIAKEASKVDADEDLGAPLPPKNEKETVKSMQSSKINKSSEILAIAESLKKVETIEGDVEAGVPRAKGTLGHEGPENIDVKLNKPDVPRGKATMGKEGPDNIDKKMDLPNVPIDSSYMGDEKRIQQSMPGISNEIKGTVIAENKNVTKEAKKLTEVDSVEHDVSIPRGKATLGKEGPDNIDVKLNKPEVPRGKATLGNEGADNIDVPANAPDVPMGEAHMGGEAEAQKGLPANNDEILKTVKMQREVQLERIASARRNEAVQTASWLVANNRISGDRETFDNVVKALMSFEVGQISKTAESMFPAKQVKTASVHVTEIKEAGHTVPGISVMESKTQSGETLQEKLIRNFALTGRLPKDE